VTCAEPEGFFFNFPYVLLISEVNILGSLQETNSETMSVVNGVKGTAGLGRRLMNRKKRDFCCRLINGMHVKLLEMIGIRLTFVGNCWNTAEFVGG
jgi:hypothetical protein